MPHFTTEQKAWHLLNWAIEWDGNGQGRSMWSYSLGLGGSHALLNGWRKNGKILGLLTPEEKSLIAMAHELAARSRHARPSIR